MRTNDRMMLLALMASCLMIALNLYSIITLQRYQDELQQQGHHHSPEKLVSSTTASKVIANVATSNQQARQPQPESVKDTTSETAEAKQELATTTTRIRQHNKSQKDKPTTQEDTPPKKDSVTKTERERRQKQQQRALQEILEEWDKVAVNATTVVSLPTNPPPVDTTTTDEMITLVAHLGSNKLERFLVMAQRWTGPLAAAVYITTETDLQAVLEFQQAHSQDLAQTSMFVLLDRNGGAYQGQYPYNVLRQLALDKIPTNSYFLTMDVDFVTTPNCYTNLVSILPELKPALQKKTVMVLPAFERTESEIQKHHGNGDMEDWIAQHAQEILPNDKASLLQHVHDQKLMKFHGDFNPGHGPTDYDRWMKQSNDDKSPFYYIDYQVKYEPYVLAYKSDTLTPYWQGFHTYHYNKYSWFMELYFDGYEFAVLNGEFFVIHLEHLYPPKQDMIKTELNKFRRHLKQKYHWNSQAYEVAISKRMNYVEPTPTEAIQYGGPPGIPRLVGWQEQNGFVFGRIFGVEGTDAITLGKEFLGTASIVKGKIQVNETITSKSGHEYFLSSEPLIRR